jgi:hypothetical protein
LFVRVILHSILREKLPPEAHGETVLELPEGSTVRDVIHRLDLPENSLAAVNEQLERSRERVLLDGSVVRFFRPSGGG